MRKTITIRRGVIKAIIFGLLFGLILVFIVEHFGNFSYIANTANTNTNGKISLVDYLPPKTPLESIYFDTPFGNRLKFSGEDFTIGDMHYRRSEFKPYSNRVKYYFKATFQDFKYVFIIGIIVAVLIHIVNNYKLKLN
ncbi:hypothetical protein AB9K26_12820 [Psychroserpens sp. XS_ASV72]|uniref:hypothetical protein n=1 Tax=Psychroserpens sp. XS_ASV72 TaxID=3241293 RepID=UPI0035183B75